MSVSAQDLVDDCYTRFGAPTVLADTTRRMIAFSVQPRDVADEVRRNSLMSRNDVSAHQWLITQVDRDAVLTRTPPSTERGLAPRTIVPLIARGIVVAYLIAIDPDQRIGVADVEQWRPTLSAVALEIEFERAESVRRRTVVAALLSSDEESRRQATDAMLETHLLDNRAPVRVVVSRIGGGRDGVSESHWDLAAGTRGVVTSIDHNLVGLLADSESAVAALCGRIVKVSEYAAERPSVGVGGAAVGLDRAYLSYRQAKRALTLATLSLLPGPVQHWDEIGSWRALLHIHSTDAEDAVDPRVLAMITGEDAEMLTIVRDYLERDGDIASLAAKLHIHRTTIYGRLKRLGSVYGIDWNNTEDRTTALIGLRIAYLHRLGGIDGSRAASVRSLAGSLPTRVSPVPDTPLLRARPDVRARSRRSSCG